MDKNNFTTERTAIIAALKTGQKSVKVMGVNILLASYKYKNSDTNQRLEEIVDDIIHAMFTPMQKVEVKVVKKKKQPKPTKIINGIKYYI